MHTQEMAAAHNGQVFLPQMVYYTIPYNMSRGLPYLDSPSLKLFQVALDCAKLTELSITIPLIANHWPPLCLNILWLSAKTFWDALTDN